MPSYRTCLTERYVEDEKQSSLFIKAVKLINLISIYYNSLHKIILSTSNEKLFDHSFVFPYENESLDRMLNRNFKYNLLIGSTILGTFRIVRYEGKLAVKLKNKINADIDTYLNIVQ